ncbi:F420-dependent oxidoreductase [Leifsonia sp. Root4]|uniref:coenzyme F420-0:L-glutamate ligase n=1 Tax=Leifsonia sp. Root4 TaxID=1736525 RepID=UPI0006FB33E5|nr:coenzyme F420-0:L-glutamate ligase [Leifsonia sp. Root4]KQW08419.1 F420-dependent oxidoreductase [Leifsonia sp. Root4]
MAQNRFIPSRLTTWPLPGMPEVRPGDDLVAMIADAARAAAEPGEPESGLVDGDILVVTSKIVSKAESRIVAAADREDAITAETVRVVATRAHPGGVTRIVENRLGIVAAAAGVDASNTADGTVLLLPLDPDASARELAVGLRALTGVRVGVILSDTLGRPWRDGQTDVAIGAAGVHVFDDLRGSTDAAGKPLQVTMPCVADEIAAATDLVKGKASGCPVAVVRGLGRFVGELDLPGAASIVRPSERDMFRLGSEEARAEGVAAGYEAGLVEGRGLGYSDGYADGFAEADAEDA